MLGVGIVAACVALACLVAQAVQSRGGRVAAWHVPCAIVMCCAASIRIAAMLYASGAPVATYVLGWCVVASFVASGIVMAPPARDRLGDSAGTWHNTSVCSSWRSRLSSPMP